MRLPVRRIHQNCRNIPTIHLGTRQSYASFLSTDSGVNLKKALRTEQSMYKTFAASYKKKFKSALSYMINAIQQKDSPNDMPRLGDICGNYEYYFDSLPSQACEDLYRQPLQRNSNESADMILDVNQLARYYRSSLAVHQVRPLLNGEYIAVSIEDTSSGATMLLCKHIASNVVYELELPIGMIDYEVAESDNKLILVLLSSNDGFRPSKVYTTHISLSDLTASSIYHSQLVKPLSLPSPLHLLYQEDDPQYFTDINRSKDDRFIFISCQSKVGSAVFAIDLHNDCQFVSLVPKSTYNKYFITSDEKSFYVTTNHLSKTGDMHIMYQPIASVCDMQWKHFWPPPTFGDSYILDMEVTRHYTIVLSRYCVELFVDIIKAEDNSVVRRVSSSDIAAVVGMKPFHFHFLGDNNRNATSFRLQLSSPMVQDVCVEICCESGKILQHTVTYMMQKHTINTAMVTSHDGYQVPLTLIRRDEVKNVSPVLLVGYGSYGVSVPMQYDHLMSYLIQDGWTIAFAHTRGGGEFGAQHHRGGMKEKKWNTFYDYIACAKFLHNEGIVDPRGLCGLGHSAGGLTLGVAVNMHPELFSGIVLRAPFVNIYDAMQDSHAPLTQHEYDEWGDANDKEMLQYINSYCPFANIRRQRYPAMHISIGLRDDKVAPFDVFRYAARIRDCYEGNIALLSVQEHADHYGPGTQAGLAEEAAKEASFLDYIVHDVANSRY